MKMSKFFERPDLEGKDFLCMQLFMRIDLEKTLVFRLYVKVNGNTTLGTYRKTVENWERKNRKEYKNVPFEGIQYSASTNKYEIQDWKNPQDSKFPYEILDAKS